MRKIVSVKTAENFLLHVCFDNGVEKSVDFNPYLKLPAFASLKIPGVFGNVINKGYFIEWSNYEIDLSADTLWHNGK